MLVLMSIDIPFFSSSCSWAEWPWMSSQGWFYPQSIYFEPISSVAQQRREYKSCHSWSFWKRQQEKMVSSLWMDTILPFSMTDVKAMQSFMGCRTSHKNVARLPAHLPNLSISAQHPLSMWDYVAIWSISFFPASNHLFLQGWSNLPPHLGLDGITTSLYASSHMETSCVSTIRTEDYIKIRKGKIGAH